MPWCCEKEPCEHDMQVQDQLMQHMHSLLTRILRVTTEVVSEGKPANHSLMGLLTKHVS